MKYLLDLAPGGPAFAAGCAAGAWTLAALLAAAALLLYLVRPREDDR